MSTSWQRLVVLLACTALAVGACSAAEPSSGAPPAGAVSPVDGQPRPTGVPDLSAVLVTAREPVVAFPASDGSTIATWELGVQNATPFTVTATVVEVLAPSGAVLLRLDRAGIADALALPGRRAGVEELAEAQAAILYLTVPFPSGAAVPDRLDTRITVTAAGLPPDGVTGPPTSVPVSSVAPPVVGPPLPPGSGYIAADSCCDSPRHRRASLALGNRTWLAQRFAVDWEQVDPAGRTVSGGDPTDPADYTIHGRTVIAAAVGTVVHVRDGLPAQTPGTLPAGLAASDADGNSIVNDIGGGLHTLYGHLQAGSLQVREGQRVVRGQPLGLVGNSGNSSAPHLHFHVIDGPSPLASEGVPYVIDRFATTGRIASQAAFDQRENTVEPLPTTPSASDGDHWDQMPLNLDLVRFD